MNEITTSRLNEIAKTVNEEHAEVEGIMKSGMERAITIGRLLYEAKKLAGHGDWLSWISENCNFSERTARGYMQVASKYPELANRQDIAVLTYTGATQVLKEEKKQVKEAERLEYRKKLAEEGKSLPSTPLLIQEPVERYETIYPTLPPSGYKKFSGQTWEMFTEQEWLANEIISSVSISIAGRFNGVNTRHFKGLTQEQALEALDMARAVIANGKQVRNTMQKYYDMKAWEEKAGA